MGPSSPELPEVERARALIEGRALGRQIVHVDDRDTYVCRPHAPGEIAVALDGAQFTAAHRQGKSMWLETDVGPVLGLHLGMAGHILLDGHRAEGDRWFDPRPPPAVAVDAVSRPGPDSPSSPGSATRAWERFTIEFADGGTLVLFDKRRLSRAVLNPNLDRLGPDAAEVSREEFRERIGRGDTPLKARLLDQSAIAGVGNLLADETLWQARLDPQRHTSSLSVEELDHLRRVLRTAIRSAIGHGGVHTGEVIPARRRGGLCPRCGTELQRGTVGGRTTYWCPAEQL
jgi:formamidopyrimidine-DNA glycosylase